MEKVKITKEQQEFLKDNDVYVLPNGDTYYTVNKFFKKTSDPDVFEVYDLNNLPADLLANLIDEL